MKNQPTRLGMAAACLALICQLSACGNGGDSVSSGSTPATLSATQLNGTVAAGDPVAGAGVSLTDATGKTTTTTANPDGTFTFTITGRAAPYVLIATDPAGINAPMVSTLAAVPTATGTAPVATANVTTLTTAVAALLVPTGNPTDLAAASALSSITPASVQGAVTKLDTALAALLTQNGLPASFDPIGTPFTANHTGADGVIDSVSVQPSPGGLALISVANPSSVITLNSATTSVAALAVPPVAADYLSFLPALLQACVANGTVSTTNPSCAAAIDPSYLANGHTGFADYHSSVAQGIKSIGSARTLTFLANGTQALIQLPYTLNSGATGFMNEVVQKLATPVTLPTGGQASWDIIGNQQAYNVTIQSQLQRRIMLDPADATSNRYEAALAISIPTTNTANASIYSASISGPGLSGKIWMLRADALGTEGLQFSSTILTAPPVSPTLTSSGAGTYRWSWQPLSSSDTQYVPGTNKTGYYAAQSAQISLSSVPLYSTYTVTVYDSTGAEIGQTSVINLTPPLDSSAGVTASWRTLSTATESAFLSPTGSAAAAVASQSVAWTDTVVDGQDVTPPFNQALIQSFPAAGGEIDAYLEQAPTPANGTFTGTLTAGINQAGAQTCTSTCSFAALTSGASRLVEVQGKLNGVLYSDVTQYRD
ncbi:MAG: hypothetical protein WBR17_12660 [Paraburkholderia sp.]|uniref:hypothetical protein n=1 Tax=Paraburkholderia sp. TaxID=1926495 RepID=UPI003C54F859